MINNLNYYNVFYMVAKTGSISRAANQLYISQPAVSKAISNLEESIGIALFVRNSRGVALTEEGTILYDYIERALDNIVKGEESLKKYNELGIGHIRIGVSTSLCKHILLDYLKPFIKDNPNIKVSIDCHSTKNTIRLLKNEEIDIGLICETELPKNITYSHVRSSMIFSWQIVIISIIFHTGKQKPVWKQAKKPPIHNRKLPAIRYFPARS